MRIKRRKKLAREWAEFKELYGLSDATEKQARAIGHPPKVLQQKLADGEFEASLSMEARIAMLYLRWQDRRLERQAADELGEIPTKPKRNKRAKRTSMILNGLRRKKSVA